MKILIIHTTYKLQGGEDVVVANEMELLKSNGENVELLKFSNTGKTLFKVLQLFFNYKSYNKTVKTIANFKPDVVHIHNLHFAGSPSIVYALKKKKVPFVITLHNYRLLCPSATLFHNGNFFFESVKKSFSWKAVLKGVYLNSKVLTFWVSCSMWLHQKLGTWQNAAKFIALGEHTKKIFLDSKYKDLVANIMIKPNFCYPAKIKTEKADYYLYLGRLTEEKGILTLLKAFANNGLKLIIAGTGPLSKEVEAHALNYNNITFLGHVDKDTANELLSRAIALIFPSLWFETFGMVIIEAFASSTPVIASNLGQLEYTIVEKYSGLHFTPGDEVDLQQKIDYYDRLTPIEKLGYQNNALNNYIENYAPDKNLYELLNIYDKAVKRNNIN
ncbi:glycosyltransferase [Mucilaginibacter sp. UYCu711]|uniref:glycosyltransferase n=1 Tax=Mucilaginibacter sp. UYCu711 TaxID=3156339 RepID=UPI003D1EA69F